MTPLSIFATSLAVAGVCLILLAWLKGRQRKRGQQQVLRWSGWLLLLGIWPVWQMVGGGDRGPAILILLVMLTAVFILMLRGWQCHRDQCQLEKQGKRRTSRERQLETGPDADPLVETNGWKKIWVFVLCGPVSLIASLLAAIMVFALTRSIGWHPANTLSLSLVVFPLAWMGLSIWSTSGMSLLKRSSGVLGVAGVSAVLTWLCISVSTGAA